MGYRNEVLLILDAEADKKFRSLINIDDDTKPQFDNLLAETKIISTNPQNNNKLYYWDSVKWYDDDDYIINIMDFLNECNSRRFKFIRIGEDTDDYEIFGNLKDEIFDAKLGYHIEFKYNKNEK